MENWRRKNLGVHDNPWINGCAIPSRMERAFHCIIKTMHGTSDGNAAGSKIVKLIIGKPDLDNTTE